MTTPSDPVFIGDGEVAELMRRTDWAKTPLGPVDRWPNGLRAAVRIVLTSRFSMWMAWGDELTFLYNDAYRADTLGTKHPRSLAAPTRELWSEVWPDIGPRIEHVLGSGQATWDEGLLLFLERSGYREETYHTFSYSPLFDDDGAIRGVLSVVTEETARLISERRVALLGKLGAAIAGETTEDGILAGVVRTLEQDPRDLPFALVYLAGEGGTARLAATMGAWAPADAAALEAGAAWQLDDVLTDGKPRVIECGGATWPRGPWQTSPTSAYVVPLASQTQGRAAGALVCGINPHRAFDAAYAEFLGLLANQVASGIAGARAYEQERRRAEELAALDRAKTAFFSNVSHEFRTPLTLMLGPLADVMEDPEVPAAARETVSSVHRNGLRLLKLVNTLLDFSRIEAGRASANFRAVDLAQLTADLASVFRGATDKAGLALVVDCPPLASPVAVDRDMWEKIVLNLLSNAFKFTLEGEIRVSLAQKGPRVELSVRDTGCGIPTAEIPYVFERFHRVEGTRGRTFEGTGIGLALVQELVRLHGGTIAVTSTEGVGSEFVVAIPIEAAPAEAAENTPVAGRTANAFVAEALRWLPDEPGPAAAPTLARERVLIADDNADMRAYLCRLLAPRWDVVMVSNGREALDAIRADRPDLLVADVMMPELDGFQLAAAVRGDRELATLPILMLSARAGEEARVEGLNAGANDYLVKPFASRELIARVDSLLRRAAMQRTEEAYLRRLGVIFEQAPVAIAVLRGPAHVYEVANPLYRAVVGGRDVIGKPLADALPELASQGIIEVLDNVFRTGQPYTAAALPLLIEGRGGALEPRVFDATFQPMFDDDGKVYGIAAIGHDVTELTVARRDAEAASRAKDEFLAMLGHELRNPLAPISTALQLLRLRSGAASRELAVIERQVAHLVGLVDDLLDVSRITRGKIELRREPVEVADAVARAIEQTSPLFEQHRHALTLDVPRRLHVDADPSRLAQILSNLLANAAKYTPAGGRIRIRARREADRIEISVADNGIGIARDMLESIFEPFTQARQAIDRAHGGLGLGLAIVSNLVRLHGGAVSVSSEGPGRGSEFVVRLPALDVTGVIQASQDVAAAVRGGARVLIVDDNIDAAQMLAELLDAGGYQTLATHDGPSALAAVESFEPQIAVLDIGLPVMDGFELARLLQQRLARTKLIALTGYGQPEDRARAAAAGFAAHFVKPVDADKLRAMIEQLVTDER
jgi:signal transduction histidine kinase